MLPSVVGRPDKAKVMCVPEQAFLDAKTRAKISLAYSDEELRAALLPYIQPAHLYESLGGCALAFSFCMHGHHSKHPVSCACSCGCWQHMRGDRAGLHMSMQGEEG